MPYYIRDAVGGYNNITDEFFIFAGWTHNNNIAAHVQNIGYIYSYKTAIWKGITFNKTIFSVGQYSQYYTQCNDIIYYYVKSSNTIDTYNMSYPYSHGYSIPLTGITTDADPCLSADVNGNLFLSSGGFVLDGNVLNYYGYNINDNIWKTFSDSEYWIKYNYDMHAMACIVHKQILYTFGGNAGTTAYLSEYYGSNMISYHDISDYNTPFLLNGHSLWNKLSQDLNPSGGYMRAVNVNELIYIIGGSSNNVKTDGTCCIFGLNSVQIFDPNTQTIKGPLDGIIPVSIANGLHSTTCHFRSTTYTINCFGGYGGGGVLNRWIYSNALLTDSPSNSPTNTPTLFPSHSTISPTHIPLNLSVNNAISLPIKLVIIFGSIITFGCFILLIGFGW